MTLDFAFTNATGKFSITALIKSMRADGFDFINENRNTFANCMVRPGGDEVVLFTSDPDCAPSFYEMCIANSDNPFLPKIHEIKKLGDHGCMIRAERLIALDHLEITPESTIMLSEAAPRFVRFIRGEVSDVDAGQELLNAIHNILQLSQTIYKGTGGRILPFCDIKPDNIFLRIQEGKYQFVFGDPLFPGSGGNLENINLMNSAYQKFGLPPLVSAIQKEVLYTSPSMPQ